MKKYEDFLEGLQKDMEIPQAVQVKFCETLENLPMPSEHNTGKHRRIGRWVSVAAIAAIVLVGGTGICLTNPVLAAKIPIIGKIFEQLENDVSFSGDFKDRAQVLTEEPENGELPDDKTDSGQQNINSTQLSTEYSTEDQGITITASEVYCDGHSVFLTAEIHMENGKFNNIPAYYTSGTLDGESTTAQWLYTRGDWNLGHNGAGGELMNNNFEGKALDDNTFLGLIKIDLDTLQETDDVLNLNFSRIGYDDKDDLYSDDISETYKYEGSWNLSIPFSIDTQDVQMIEVNETMENGCGVEKVFISPYQVIVYLIRPVIPYTEADVRRDYEGFIEKTTEAGESPIPFEDFHYEEPKMNFDLTAFTQDDMKVDSNNSNSDDKVVLAVQDKDISQLQLFLANDPLAIVPLSNLDEVKELADYEIVVDVK